MECLRAGDASKDTLTHDVIRARMPHRAADLPTPTPKLFSLTNAAAIHIRYMWWWPFEPNLLDGASLVIAIGHHNGVRFVIELSRLDAPHV